MPPVVDPATEIIFCEGRPGSLDDLFLGNLMPVGHVLIKPVGGKHGMRAFIEGYLDSYHEEARPSYLGFRDRDFDVEPPELSQLIRLRGEKPIWLSYRAAIENYLIDADLIRQYWKERESTPGWQHGPALSTAEIEDHIQASARELVSYQAVRWALARLKPGTRWPEIPTTWTKRSGHIPPSLDFEDCMAQACQLVASFRNQIHEIHPDHLQKYAESYRKRFTAPRFFGEREYLVWFHGKDHLAQLCRRLASNFPQRHYADWAAENVDVSKHPDLRQLVDLAH